MLDHQSGPRAARQRAWADGRLYPQRRLILAHAGIPLTDMLLISQDLDIYRNLARESYLLETRELAPPILFFWQSRPAVVIGKNQNPWVECALKTLAESDGRLARRLSGGGAVYHDPGNLNCTLIVPRDQYRPDLLYQIMMDGLQGLGIASRADRTRHSILVQGGKVSGQAFCLRARRALLHGTLLINSDLDQLNRLLAPLASRPDSRAIASLPATVANIGDRYPGCTIEKAITAISGAADRLLHTGTPPAEELGENAHIIRKARQFSNWNWLYSLTPRFHITLSSDLSLQVERGLIKAVHGEHPFPRWLGQRFHPPALFHDSRVMSNIEQTEEINETLARLWR